MLHGEGRVIGTALVTHPAARAVGFTGSQAAGRALCDAAAARPDPIPVFAEMSSLNPVFVLPEALATRTEEIARGFAASVAGPPGSIGLLLPGLGDSSTVRDAFVLVRD
jgi:NADP-dependent aldehyde dehydrogenase